MKTAMILAAGRGERLKPLTQYQPKALAKVHGIPLIEYHLTNLAKAGFTRIIINHAYLGDQIRRCLGQGRRWGVDIVYSPEPPGGLETGGGIFNALPLMQNQPFVTINADIYTDFDFSTLILTSTSLAHLVLGQKPSYAEQGDYGLDSNKQLNNNKEYTYLGIACYQPEFFHQVRFGRYSITPIIRRGISHLPITGEYYSGHWSDIGTLKRLAEANQLTKL